MYEFFDNPPAWFLNSFGLYWLIWTVSEFKAGYILYRNRGVVRRDNLDRLKLYTYVLYTLVWWSWRINGVD